MFLGEFSLLFIPAAFLLDLLIGDPRWIPHPVVLMGKVISGLENFLRRTAADPGRLQAAGVVLVALVVGGSYLVTVVLLVWLYRLDYRAGVAVEIWLIAATISTRGLADAAGSIHNQLRSGNIAEARREVGMIVGRDTGRMDEAEITRATVETVAENTVDGVTAPLIYAFLGGAPLAMAYRAANTLDSMVGYKNDRYLYFGRAAARFDDFVNYLPARLTGVLMIVAALILRLHARRGWTVVRRDAVGHPSPNSGIPEAAVAGALGVRLGGWNSYHGSLSFRPYLGEAIVPLQAGHIRLTVRVMYVTSVLALTCGLILSGLAQKVMLL
ncbi:MAG: cobalamin biosynthesis protein CobD [Peptococcaceae bacterium]|nr:MAG: cobalamin biosynthesis protein CobD [Peptococcaceae bacterium]